MASIKTKIEHVSIGTSGDLSDWCQKASSSLFLSIDTEFKWEKTYWPQLCIVQLATCESIAIIDVLAGADLTPLFELLKTEDQLKIFHAARQDLEVLNVSGFPDLDNVVDCQIGAALIGLDEQIGYAPLVSKVLDIELDKSQTRTDWAKRPLSKAQNEYAADDVRYLGAIYHYIENELARLERFNWLQEDCRQLHTSLSPNSRRQIAWKKVRGLGKLENEIFVLLVALATWREKLAQDENMPRSWVLQDAELIQLANERPDNSYSLSKLLRGRSAILRKYGDDLLELLGSGFLGKVIEDIRPSDLDSDKRKWVRRMKDVVKEEAQALGISPSVLCSGGDLKSLAQDKVPDRLQSGWRRQFLGGVLLAD